MAKTGRKTSKQILTSVISGRASLQDPKIVEKKNRRNLAEVKGRKPSMEKEVYQTIDWLMEGKSVEWCTQTLRNTINEQTQRVYAPRFVENIVTASNQLLNLYYRSQIYQVEKLHITRYNEIIIEKLNKDYDSEEFAGMKPWILEGIMIADLADVLQAMKHKETLLGMHRKTFRLTINNQNNIFIPKAKVEPKPKLDIAKLTLEEQVELLSLIQISSRTEDEMHGVILASPIKQDTIDIEVEEVINDNIKYIEPFTKPNLDNQGSTLLDIKATIHQRLLDAAKKQNK